MTAPAPAGNGAPTVRELTRAICELLQSMPGMGASESDRGAWMVRKQELLAQIEAAQ